MRQGKVLMWVIESPGVGVFGQMFVQLSGARVELADGVTRAYLYSFRIQPAYRCQGLGSRFLCFVEEDLVQRRFIWASLNVGRDNPAARRFYERHGYRIVATEPGRWSYLDDRGHRQQVHEPAWRMQKSLPPGHVKDR